MKRTQRERVLEVLQANPGRWVATCEIDDATRITRVPARVYELVRDGYPVERKPNLVEMRGAHWAAYRLAPAEPQQVIPGVRT